MAAQKAEGIILRRYYLRETSYILVVFTKEFGKIKGTVKGVRNPYPQFGGNFEIFTQCNMLFYKRKRSPLDLITHCETVESFLHARNDIERLTYASYFIELTDKVTVDRDKNEELYNVLYGSLRMLSGGGSPRRICRIFELKLLGTLGLSPGLEQCVVCGSAAEKDICFSEKSGGILCAECSNKDRSALKMSPGAMNFMRKVQSGAFEKISRIKVSREVGRETEEALSRFLKYHLGGDLKSIRFLEQLKKAGIT